MYLRYEALIAESVIVEAEQRRIAKPAPTSVDNPRPDAGLAQSALRSVRFTTHHYLLWGTRIGSCLVLSYCILVTFWCFLFSSRRLHFRSGLVSSNRALVRRCGHLFCTGGCFVCLSTG